MPKKLNGALLLSKIPKSLIRETEKGGKLIYVDIVPNKDGEDKYGNTHSIQVYDKDTKETIYLGNLKTVEFGKASAPASTQKPTPAPAIDDPDSDLPF